MDLSPRNTALIAVGGAFALLMLWIAHNESGGNATPRYDATNLGNPNLSRLDIPFAYFAPEHCTDGQQVKFTPHRYPVVAGHNVSALMHHGMDAMRKAAPQDDDWRVGAPAEQMW